MMCAACHVHVQPMEHLFFEGLALQSRRRGERPVREWRIVAPLYFVANATFTEMVEPFCGAHCRARHQPEAQA